MTSIGRYQITESLGQGGMGTVYKAFDPLLARVVAVKVISTQLVGSTEHHERFFREARAAAHLSHRNIITIYDLGEENGTPFLAMEFLEGRDLDHRMRAAEGMQLARMLEIALGVCDGLAHAHACGIIHRDIKPANIFITDTGEVKILDFGLARLVTSEITRSNVMLGTVNYMAPEQIRAEKMDHRADIFSFGTVLYELFGGRKAFTADSFASTLYKILQETPEPLERINPDVPAELSGIVERAMAKAREDRYQHVTDLARDLERVYSTTHGADPRFIRSWDTDGRPRTAARTSQVDVFEAPTMAGVPVPMATGRPPSAPRPPTRPGSGSRSDDATFAGTADQPPSGPPAAAMAPVPGSGAASTPGVTSSARGWMLATAVATLAALVAGGAWLWRSGRTSTSDPPRIESAAEAVPPARPAPSAPTPPAPAAPVAPPAAGSERTTPSESEVREQTPAPPTTDDRARVTRLVREARAAVAAGRFADASRLVGEVLRADPGNRDAQTLRGRIAADLTARADRALEQMETARRAATAAGAPALAADLLAAAQRSEATARRAYAGQQFAEAVTRADDARALFQDAESAARRQAAADSERARTAEAEQTRAAEAERARAAEAERRNAERPPAPAPVPPPAPAPAPAPAGPTAEQAIGEVVNRYVAALEGRDLNALRAVWPGLGGAQEAAIRSDFENARAIEASIRNVSIDVSGATARATGQRRYVVRTRDGHRLQSDTVTTIQLRRNGAQWVIDSIRHQAQ